MAEEAKESDPRDTQFAGLAEKMFEDLEDLFNAKHYDESECDFPEVEKDVLEIKKYLAQQTYDLVQHTLTMVPHLIHVAEAAQDIHAVMPYVPDPTTLKREGE